MTVKEFCNKNSLKFQTIYKKIGNHKHKELEGHITKEKGSPMMLDDFAVDFLTPFNVKVIQAIEECEGIAHENDDLRSELACMKFNLEQSDGMLTDIIAENEKLKAEIKSLTVEASANSDKYNAEISAKDSRIAELENALAAANSVITERESRITELTEENASLTEELDGYRNKKSWFGKKNQ